MNVFRERERESNKLVWRKIRLTWVFICLILDATILLIKSINQSIFEYVYWFTIERWFWKMFFDRQKKENTLNDVEQYGLIIEKFIKLTFLSKFQIHSIRTWLFHLAFYRSFLYLTFVYLRMKYSIDTIFTSTNSIGFFHRIKIFNN